MSSKQFHNCCLENDTPYWPGIHPTIQFIPTTFWLTPIGDRSRSATGKRAILKVQTIAIQAIAISYSSNSNHDRSRSTLSKLVNERASLSAEMALRVEKAFGPTADRLMRVQLAYDMAQARLHEREIQVSRYQPSPV